MEPKTPQRSATGVLVAEHEVIVRVLTAFDRLLDASARTRAVPRDDATRAIEFFRTFADACHHGKEENVLFPKLVEMGLPERAGPLAVMRMEHDQGRALVEELVSDLDEACSGNELVLERFIRTGISFTGHLRDHIAKENGILFPLSDSFLDDSANEEVLGGYDVAETEHEPGMHERMLTVADELCRAYSVSDDDVAKFQAAGHGCGPRLRDGVARRDPCRALR